ncbi:hypothetical protein [Bacilliculturomica massiliensis]|uniref:hypothetical protein n=1 Tax=Bacilliculturomica massiliensis TaxID=1917867 RepID=UPI001030B417|nr:hypothetical protein [Bacilliculturomica massiliensis]
MAGYREDDFYDDRDERYNMYRRASQCGRFARRGDMSVFSMSEYQSCENCRYMAADHRCAAQMDRRFPVDMR